MGIVWAGTRGLTLHEIIKHYYMKYSLLAVAATCLLGSWQNACAQRKTAVAADEITLDKPVVEPATQVTSAGFTANWQPVEGADAYCVFVYTHKKADADGVYSIIDEDFSAITMGTVGDPVESEDTYTLLDGYTELPNWSVYEGLFARGMVGGIVYSPYIDLRNDGGRYRVTLDVYSAVPNDSVVVEAHTTGRPTEKVGKRMDPNASGELVFEFSNGGHDTFFSIHNMDAYVFFVDRVRVEQNLKAGDDLYTMVDLNEAVEASEGSYASFPSLTYAPDATQVYYDLYAVKRVYDSAQGGYKQYYSPFSDMQAVTLDRPAGIGELASASSEDANAWIQGMQGGIEVSLSHAGQVEVYGLSGELLASRELGIGRHRLIVQRGCYIVQAGGKAAKVWVK